MTRQTKYILGMIASIATAIAGAAPLFDPPWGSLLVVIGLAGTAVTAYQADRRQHRLPPRQRPPKRL